MNGPRAWQVSRRDPLRRSSEVVGDLAAKLGFSRSCSSRQVS
jgi:hypothetical protein